MGTVQGFTDINIAKARNQALVQKGRFQRGLPASKMIQQPGGPQFIAQRLNACPGKQRVLRQRIPPDQGHVAKTARVIVDNLHPLREVKDDMVMHTLAISRMMKCPWQLFLARINNPERPAHAQMHDENVPPFQIAQQIFGPATEALNFLALKSLRKFRWEGKAQVCTPLLNLDETLASHYGLQPAPDSFNFGKFRHRICFTGSRKAEMANPYSGWPDRNRSFDVNSAKKSRKIFWSDYTSPEFDSLDKERTIAIQPVAAFEQHGPHLSVATDTIIAEGMIEETIRLLPDDLTVLILPTQPIGKSNEHIRSKGTLTLSAHTALRVWMDIGESVHRAGIHKLVFINSHGGNADLLSVVARELRIKCQMLVVHAAWRRFGLPDGLFDQRETTHGIHGGDIETSLMLHFRPDLVRMDKARDFVSAGEAIEKEFTILRPTGFSAFGWIAPDLNAAGTVGNAALATAEKGKAVAQYEAVKFIELLRDMQAFSLDRLA